MKFGMNPGPYYRSNRSTTHIMMELMIGLAVIWLSAIVFYFIQSSANGVLAIVNPIIAMVTAVVVEALFMLPKTIKEKRSFKDLLDDVFHSYGYVSGMILALILPVATSWYAIVVSTIIGVGVAKMLFGGFGHNIFNPAIVGRIICQTCFLDKMAYDAEITTGATITTAMGSNGWSLDLLNTGHISFIDLLFGNYRGALGETFTIILLIVGIVLVIRKVIDWRAPVIYLATIYVATFIMGLCGGYGVDSFEYALVQVALGGVMFGAVFCLTDPVTSPTSRAGRVFFGMGAALITMLIRYCASAPEGVAYSILFMNLFTPLIDLAVKGLSKEKTRRNIITTSVMGAVAIVGGLYLGFSKIDKMGFFNYEYSFADKTGEFTATINYAGAKDGIESYDVSVTGYVATNTEHNFGDVRTVFAGALDKYENGTEYPNYQFVVNDNGTSLDLTYEKDDAEQTIEGVLKLKTDNTNDTYTIVDSVSGYYLPTDVSTEEAVYSLEIADDYSIILTMADGHTSQDNNSMSYASMSFTIDIDYENKVVVATHLKSTGAGGGYGDAMLDFENTPYAPYLSDEAAMKLLNFYATYVNITTPVPFSTYEKYNTQTALIDTVNSDLHVGATYTANGFMYMMNRVIEYAQYYHQSLSAGKVVR